MSILRPTGTLGKQSTGNAVNQKIAAVTLAIAGAFNSVEAAPVSHTFLGGTVDPIILAQGGTVNIFFGDANNIGYNATAVLKPLTPENYNDWATITMGSYTGRLDVTDVAYNGIIFISATDENSGSKTLWGSSNNESLNDSQGLELFIGEVRVNDQPTNPVHEPGSLALVGLGAAGAFASRRRKEKDDKPTA